MFPRDSRQSEHQPLPNLEIKPPPLPEGSGRVASCRLNNAFPGASMFSGLIGLQVYRELRRSNVVNFCLAKHPGLQRRMGGWFLNPVCWDHREA